MVAYLYFIQGVIVAIPRNIILTYSDLPESWILSIFSASVIAFSLKFITAPFIEKFTNLKYGKRKTWIVTSQVMASVTIFIGAFLTSDTQEVGLAVVLIFAIFFVTLQDISIDAAAIK